MKIDFRKMKLDYRKEDEKDDTPLLIEAGVLKQLIRYACKRPDAELCEIPAGRTISGILLGADSKEIELTFD